MFAHKSVVLTFMPTRLLGKKTNLSTLVNFTFMNVYALPWITMQMLPLSCSLIILAVANDSNLLRPGQAIQAHLNIIIKEIVLPYLEKASLKCYEHLHDNGPWKCS